MYHRGHVLIFSWHQKRSIYSCWRCGRRPLQWMKPTATARCVAATLPALLLRCSLNQSGKKNGRTKKQKNNRGYISSSGQCPFWDPWRRGMYSIDSPWDKSVTLQEGGGGDKFWVLCFSFYSSKTTSVLIWGWKKVFSVHHVIFELYCFGFECLKKIATRKNSSCFKPPKQ